MRGREWRELADEQPARAVRHDSSDDGGAVTSAAPTLDDHPDDHSAVHDDPYDPYDSYDSDDRPDPDHRATAGDGAALAR